MHENHSSANDTHKRSTTFDYHPDQCIALRLALLGFSGGKGAPKVGLTRQSVECPHAVRNTAGSSVHPSVHDNNRRANEKHKMSTTFDCHPDPCIALRLASVGISSGKGASKVGLRASLRVRPGISTTVGCSIATCKARKKTMA